MGKGSGMAGSGLWRSRWAALGAAVAVSVGGGGVFLAQAAPGVNESTIVSVIPARVLDTRDPVNVGLVGPFVSGVSQKLLVTGAVPTTTGTATVVPTGATGVLLNVTAVGATADGFISVRPGDASGAPSTSSLNFSARSVVPNAVQVALPTAGANAGQIDITYDAYGAAGPTVDVLVDVVGYTTNQGIQSLVADLAATNARVTEGVANLAATNARITDGPEVIARQSSTPGGPLVPQVISMTVNFSTTRASRLDVQMTASTSLTCAAGGTRYVFLRVDGTNVPGSIVQASEAVADETITLRGVTSVVVPAGPHLLEFAQRCVQAGNFSGAGFLATASATIGYVADASPSTAALDSEPIESTVAIECPGVLSDDGAMCTTD